MSSDVLPEKVLKDVAGLATATRAVYGVSGFMC